MKHYYRLASLVGAVAIVAAACGSSATPSPAASSAAPAASTAAPAASSAAPAASSAAPAASSAASAAGPDLRSHLAEPRRRCQGDVLAPAPPMVICPTTVCPSEV